MGDLGQPVAVVVEHVYDVAVRRNQPGQIAARIDHVIGDLIVGRHRVVRAAQNLLV